MEKTLGESALCSYVTNLSRTQKFYNGSFTFQNELIILYQYCTKLVYCNFNKTLREWFYYLNYSREVYQDPGKNDLQIFVLPNLKVDLCQNGCREEVLKSGYTSVKNTFYKKIQLPTNLKERYKFHNLGH